MSLSLVAESIMSVKEAEVRGDAARCIPIPLVDVAESCRSGEIGVGFWFLKRSRCSSTALVITMMWCCYFVVVAGSRRYGWCSSLEPRGRLINATG